MKLSYSVSGAKRKALVGAISQELNAPTKYLGAPTFAYDVGGYHIDKNGTLYGPDNLDLEDILHRKGFDATDREYNEPDTYESGLGGMGALPSPEELDAEALAYAERELRRLKLEDEQVPDYSNRGPYGGDYIPGYEDLALTEEEDLGLGRRRRKSFQGENGMRADDVPDPDEPDRLVIEMPLDGFTPEKLDNLSKLVKAKASLLKKALSADDLSIQQTEDSLKFPWFSLYAGADEVQAYVTFIAKLCEAAKTKRRVTAKEYETDNPKYTMRCWLLSLGFIGDEYRVSRKILLQNLSGSSAFRTPKSDTNDE